MLKRKATALLCAAALTLSLWTPALTVSAQGAELAPQPSAYSGAFADSPSVGQLRVTCGASGYVKEQYLSGPGASEVRKVTIGGAHTAMSRAIKSGEAFTYEIPVADMQSEPDYLSMTTYGKPVIAINGQEVYNGLDKKDTSGYTPREFKLDRAKIKEDGKLTVTIRNAQEGGDYAGVLWLEVGHNSLWQTRAEHIVWDTEGVLWQVGYFDGTANEFCGGQTEITAGGAFCDLNKTGTIKLTWNQAEKKAGSDYWLLVGVIRGGDTVIDIGDDGTEELNRSGAGEKVYDLKVTDDISVGENVVRIDNGGQLDFVALVESRDGAVSDDELRVVFKGNEMARDWSRLANNTMYWHNDFMVDKSTGYIDASLMNGIFVNGYWVADAAPAAVEMSKWGYYPYTMQATKFWENAVDYCRVDNGAAAVMLTTMVQMMKTENFTGEYTQNVYASMKTGMDYYCDEMDKSSVDMIRGNNWETTSGGYAMYNNSSAYFALLNGVLAAQKTGKTADAEKWSAYAARLKTAITKEMLLTEDINWMGNNLPAGSFRYSITESGVDAGSCAAGWFGVGSAEDLYYGYEGDAVPEWRAAVNAMLDYHPGAFWDDWAMYGHNRGFGTSYGVLSERGGWPLSAMLMSDRMEMANKNLEHVVYNSVDLHFDDDNEGVQETSPWVLLREVSKNDRGIKGADIGNGGASEDMNLVEYVVTMKNVRIMAGIDDSLSGDDNLKILPRIPKVWDGVDVNSWPVMYKDGEDYKTTKVSYDYSLAPKQAAIDVIAENAVQGVELRFGPFEKSADITGATVNGAAAEVTEKVSGDAKWAYVKTDIGTANTRIVVGADLPALVQYEDFNDGNLEGFTAVTGTAANENGRAQLTAPEEGTGVLLSGTELTTANGMVYSADVQMDAAGETGILFGANAQGEGGYRVTLTGNEAENVFGSIAMVDNTTGEDVLRNTLNVNPGRAYNIKIAYLDGAVAISLNGVLVSYAYLTVPAGYYGFTTTSKGTFDILSMDNSATEDMMVEIVALDSTVGGKTEAEVVTDTALTVKTKGVLKSGGAVEINSAEIKTDAAEGIVINGDKVTLTKPGDYTVWTELTIKGEPIQSENLTLHASTLSEGTKLIDETFEEKLFPGTAYNGDWSVENGQAKAVSEGDAWYVSENAFTDFTYSADLILRDGNAVGLTFRNSGNPANNGYDLIIDKVDGRMKLCRRPYTGGWEIGNYTFAVETNRTYHVDVIAKGDSFKVYLDGFLAIEATDGRYTSGRIGIFSYDSTANFDNIKLYSDMGLDENATLALTTNADFLFKGTSTALSLIATLKDGSKLDLTDRLDEFGVSFEAGDPSILSVSGNTVTAIKDGETTLKAKLTANGTEVFSNEITVKAETLKNIEMVLPSDQVQVGKNISAKVNALLSDGTKIDLTRFGGVEFSLISSDEEVLKPSGASARGAARGVAQLKAQVKLGGEIAAETENVKLYVYGEDDAAWISVFESDFETAEGALEGWTTVAGDWNVSDGKLNATGRNDMWILNTAAGKAGDVRYSGDVTLDDIGAGISIRMTQSGNGVLGYDIGLDTNWGLQIAKRNPGWQKVAANDAFIPQRGVTYHVEVEAIGPKITIKIDGEQLLTYTDPNPYLEGYFGAFVYNKGNIDNLSAQKFAYEPVESISVAPAGGKTILQGEGDSVQLQIAANPSNASNQRVEWSVVSGPATVDENGLLTATGYGKISVKAVSLDITGKTATAQLEVVDKRLLKMTIDYADGRDLEHVNIHIVELFNEALAHAKEIYLSAAATQQDIYDADDALLQMLHYLSFESNPEELIAIIELAEAMDLSGYPDNAVKAEFDAALKNAKDVLADTTNLNEQYKEAIERLQNAISRISINLKALIEEIARADGILSEYDKFKDEGKEEFKAAYDEAKAELQNPQSQQSVYDATFALREAILKLRRIPNRDELQKLIEQSKQVNTAKYTAETVLVFHAALSTAERVMADPDATQEEINKAYGVLSAAKKALVPISHSGGDDPGDNPSGGDKQPGDTPTGDAGSPLAATALLALAAAACIALRRKKQ